MRRARGFILVEFSVVLVIVGLLLGGLMKGQAVIGHAMANSVADEFRAIPLMIHSYVDSYRAVPGDDRRAKTNFGGDMRNGNGNGIIEGRWNSHNIADESVLVWQHLNSAGLMRVGIAAGSPTGASQVSADLLPHDALGHPIGIQALIGNLAAPIRGLRGAYAVCSPGLTAELARNLDRRLDDGLPDHGGMLAAPDAAVALGDAIPVTNFNSDDRLTVCLAF